MYAVETPAAGLSPRPVFPGYGSPFRIAGQVPALSPLAHYPFPALDEPRAGPLHGPGPGSGEALADLLADELAAAFAPPPGTENEEAEPFDAVAPLFGRDGDGPALLEEAPPADNPESRRAVAVLAAVAGLAGLVGAGTVFGVNALMTRVGLAQVEAAAPVEPAPAKSVPAARTTTVVAAAVATSPPFEPAASTAAAKPIAAADAEPPSARPSTEDSVEATITAAVPPVALPHAPPEIETERTIIVQPGDSLSDIAKRAYGDHREFQRIFEANRDVLRRPEQLKVGMTLRIP